MGPYSERRFAGRFLGHGFPFQDKLGQWWCTAFYNGNIPPISRSDLKERPLPDTAYTINKMGTTIVPLEVKILDDGDVSVRAKDPDYTIPGPDEVQQF
jgi:xylan 1,4-beta-xylosidase